MAATSTVERTFRRIAFPLGILGTASKSRSCSEDVSPQDGLRDAQIWCTGRKKKQHKNTSLIFFKAFLINAVMQSQFVVIYKYGNTLKWGPWGEGPKPNKPCSNSWYLLLFVFIGSRAPWEQFLLWWNWTESQRSSLQERANAPPPHGTLAKRDSESPGGWSGGWSRWNLQGEWGCGGRSVWGGREGYSKHLANDL